MTDRADLFPVGADAHSAPASAPEETPFASGAEVCPVCGLDPCGCDIEIIPVDGFIPIYDQADLREEPAPIPGEAAAADRLAAWRSPAIAAFIDRRAALQAKHGGKAVTDPSRPAPLIARDLKERGSALVDRLGGRAHALGSAAASEQLEIALATAATAGALALALYERLAAELAEAQAA